jgi:hypothetical protein
VGGSKLEFTGGELQVLTRISKFEFRRRARSLYTQDWQELSYQSSNHSMEQKTADVRNGSVEGLDETV